MFDAPSTGRLTVQAATQCRRQLVAKGIDLAAYNTSENAADFAALRTALGVAQWDVFGHSYGTDLALTYMRLDPQGIHSVILDGVAPPSVATPGWTGSSLKESFDTILRACATQPACRARYPDTRATFSTLVNRFEANPVATMVKLGHRARPVKVVIDGGALVNWLARASHHGWTVPMELDQAAHGNIQSIAEQWAQLRVLPPEGIGNFAYGLSYSIGCREWVPFEQRPVSCAPPGARFPASRARCWSSRRSWAGCGRSVPPGRSPERPGRSATRPAVRFRRWPCQVASTPRQARNGAPTWRGGCVTQRS